MHGSPGSLPAAAGTDDSTAPASIAPVNIIAAAMESFMSCVPLGCIPDDRSER
jgi:hypothetical protein